MNKKAVYAILLALILPLVCYFIIKTITYNAVDMPRHYYPDSISKTISKGKEHIDTIWHKLPDLQLTNQLGQKVSLSRLDNKIIVADFFFTRCPTICPRLTSNMKWLQASINNAKRVGDKTPDFVHYISVSIDPERDSVQQLKHWADRFQINPETWWLLTGNKKIIYDYVINELKLGLVDGEGVDTAFIHTDRFVLIDGKKQIRGYYNGLDSAAIGKLAKDVVLLSLEKDSNKKSFLADKFSILLVVFAIAAILVALLLIILKTKK